MPIEQEPPQSATKVDNSTAQMWAFGLLVVVVGAFIYWNVKNQITVRIQCAPFEGGYACDAKHDGDEAKDVNVCWDIVRVCQSGERSVARKCSNSRIEANGSARSLIATSEFSNHKECVATAVSVENIGTPDVTSAPTTTGKNGG